MQICTFSFTELFLQSYSGLFKWARRKTGGDQRCFLGQMIPWWFVRPFVWQKILRSASLQCLWQEWQADFQLCRPLCFLFWTRTYCWIFFHFPLGKTSKNKRWLVWQKLAGLEKLRDSRPEAVERPGAVAGLERNFCHHFVVRLLWKHSLHPAGLSLGEYTALCAAGVFTFEEGLTWFVAMKLFVQTANDGPLRYGVGKGAWCSNGWGGQEPTTGRWRRHMFGGKVPRLLLLGPENSWHVWEEMCYQ